MRRTPLCLPLALALTACTTTPVSVPSGATPFDEYIGVPYPIGAYEEEFVLGYTADVLYRITDATRASPTEAQFTFEIEVPPEIGRVLGFRNTLTCEMGGDTSEASSEEVFGEVEAGTHSLVMDCEIPRRGDELLVQVAPHQHIEDPLNFTGTVS
ncbi:hypothetical protein ACFWTE_22885 [Nocardiopsis sp. NPDC058631]|uniref:hypothetical protein n=1 Tax=Nocardiopsis sp. NPDC058631 TaxID=3346566 RepID=UPI00365965CB